MGLVGYRLLNNPVRYHGSHITTVQETIKSNKVTTSVYNSTLKKTHSILISIPTTQKDSAKAKRSTFANYVHKKDASIASFVFYITHIMGIPLYSVHDCFVVLDIYVRYIC